MTSIFFRTAIIFIILSLCMKFMGKREIGELEVGELVTTLLVSEICSIPIDDPDIPLLNAILPVIFIVSMEIIVSYFKNKSRRLKRIIDGNAVFLIKSGKLNQKALKDNRISLEEFFAAIRQNGVGNLSEIEHCILEANGKISVLKNNSNLNYIVISDGEIVDQSLKALGFDENWMNKKLDGNKIHEVFLMTADSHGNTNIILKEES